MGSSQMAQKISSVKIRILTKSHKKSTDYPSNFTCGHLENIMEGRKI